MLMDLEIEYGRVLESGVFAEPPMAQAGKQAITARETHEVRSFELPGSVWAAMFASYAVFFAALMIATGRDGSAVFAIVVSILYAVMYFGTAATLNGVDHSARPKTSPLQRGKGIETATGWLSNSSANAQILTVPILFAVFACAIAVIRSFV